VEFLRTLQEHMLSKGEIKASDWNATFLAAEKLHNHPDTVVRDFAAAAVARLDSFSSTLQDLQNRTRNGYPQ
jgi:hypothetical protein